jgi:putative addiction module component (TIGR02574 family)
VAATIEKLVQDALTLSDKERAKLAHALLKSLDNVKEEDADAAWDAEIEKRVGRIKEGTAKGRPADEVFRDIRARYQ